MKSASYLIGDEVAYDDFDSLEEDYFTQGWTDGLPVIPPTPEKVEGFLEAAGLDATEVIGHLPTRQVTATAGLVAVNAVMAGCLPEYFPVVVAALRAHLSLPLGNAHSTTASLLGPAHAVIVNGPIRGAIGVESGLGCFGPGFRANATIGRAVRLVIRNVGQSIPGAVDRATFSSPARYSFCFAENEESAHPWHPLHVQRGFDPKDSTATVVSVMSIDPIASDALEPAHILRDIADELRHLGSYSANYKFVRDRAEELLGDNAAFVFVVGREHMRYFHDAGWPKEQAQAVLLELMTAPSKGPTDHPLPYKQPEQFLLVAAGGFGLPETHVLVPHLSAPVTVKV